MGFQRVGHNLVTEQQQICKDPTVCKVSIICKDPVICNNPIKPCLD